MKKYVVVVISLILVLCVGVSYAWFSGMIFGDSKQISINAKELKIIFTDSDTLSSKEITPGWSNSKIFSVKNESNGTFNYNITIKGLVNTFVTEGFFKYKITSTNGGYNMEDYVDIPKSDTAQDVVIAYDIDIEKGITQEYQIEFIYEDSETIDQSEDMGKIFKGTLMVEEGTVNPNIKYSVTLNVENAIIEDTNIKETIKKGSVEFNVTPNEGYTLGTNVTCDNNASGEVENGKVTISNVTANTICELDTSLKEYLVTVTSNNNDYGTVSPENQSVIHGDSATITISPKTGYKYISNDCSGTMNIDNTEMTISNITAIKTCVVTFEENPSGYYYVMLIDGYTYKYNSSRVLLSKIKNDGKFIVEYLGDYTLELHGGGGSGGSYVYGSGEDVGKSASGGGGGGSGEKYEIALNVGDVIDINVGKGGIAGAQQKGGTTIFGDYKLNGGGAGKNGAIINGSMYSGSPGSASGSIAKAGSSTGGTGGSSIGNYGTGGDGGQAQLYRAATDGKPGAIILKLK